VVYQQNNMSYLVLKGSLDRLGAGDGVVLEDDADVAGKVDGHRARSRP
jgi:hypothetical protein